ncbi:lipase/acyltransferase domain-containing protein [Corallococcus exercitus]|uniref:Alpha/beta hydrolase n=1 Tax=Corallococcus exercitus TaxID=2316736 RepID=A0A7Y4NB54_9BACT|nr:hypothetical protein [Corallococcus exercitus]NOK07868.1 hypothetical protein [Corallococcus exercitus]
MLLKQEYYADEVWPGWLNDIRNSPHRAIFLHGVMGSELYDRQRRDTLWLDTGIWHEVDNLAFLNVTPQGGVDGPGQFIYARSTVNLPVFGDHYADCFAGIGWGRFNFDWRDGIGIEAQRLALFLRSLRTDGQPLRFVTHSMGGCVLLRMLASTREFDDAIERIVFCAPPFWGALKPIRVIEDGTGTPADWLISNATLRQSAVSMPGLFNLLVAPREYWPTQVPGLDAALKYPVRTGQDLYRAASWTNPYRLDLRDPLLRFSYSGYQFTRLQAQDVAQRFASRTVVIVGLNGRTDYAALMGPGGWTLHSQPPPAPGKLSNGDGTVLFQASLLPGLPTTCYHAYVPPEREDTHSDLVNLPEVINAILTALTGGSLASSGLVPYADFLPTIDWSLEVEQAPEPGPTENLGYLERARLRARLPLAQWGPSLDPGGNDDRLFHATRQSAFKVLHGADLRTEAGRLGVSYRFLADHIRDLLLPVLSG